jgi:hypothetical protein
MHQGRTRVYDEAYCSYVEKVNPRRTLLVGKRAISDWKLISFLADLQPVTEFFCRFLFVGMKKR